MRIFPAIAPVALLALPAFGAEFPCPPGWDHVAEGCDSAQCIAPMGASVIQVERFASIEDRGLPEALDGYEDFVAADGTPVHDLLVATAIDIAGLPALRRDYSGSALGRDLRVTLLLVQHHGQDILMRAVWDTGHGLLLEHMLDGAIAGWNPRAG
ncbi:hypothetical protein [Maritimibacter sp. HL-12]|uniref:hypothetical protein n=1 Tax=Maritimibacter sp. HL-12 TaxID=1162418 RepID=UPI000A0F154D|nr:hypothetical protein [Maritimibacter sp. HL-12]SMH41538.1 hypothetical protein SAMN05661107_1258 [Maritimibacter sp. HL-12]